MCRLVCHQWNATAEERLLALSRIRFHNDRDDMLNARLPVNFIYEFGQGILMKKCNKFCFNSPEGWIEYEHVTIFFEKFGEDMKELTIFQTTIRDCEYPLSNKELINLIPWNLTKLDVVCDRVENYYIISIKRLKNIKFLRLGSCILKITDGVFCAPVELRLKNIFFLQHKTDFQKCVKLNNYFDFRNLKVLHLHCCETENIELNLADRAVNLKTLVLDRVKIRCWEVSTWTIQKLTLCKKTRFAATDMKIEELDYSASVLDMANLPKTIKRLTMLRYETKIRNIEAARRLVNLTHLELLRREFSVLKNFQNCSSLTHLHLCPIDEEDEKLVTVDLSLIPKTLRVFRLTYNCELIGKIDFELETVIFDRISFGDVYDFLVENLKAKNLFIFSFDFDFDTDDGTGIDEAVEELSLQSYIVGPLLPSKDDRFSFTSLENPKAEYLMKNFQDGTIVKKELVKTEIDRLKKAWWTNDQISF